MALSFVQNEATYQFDGMPQTLQLTDTLYPDYCQDCYQFVYRFQSAHAGYGNRAGQMMMPVVTRHQAMVTVMNGQVTNGVMDQKWDMIRQRLMDGSGTSTINIAQTLGLQGATQIDVYQQMTDSGLYLLRGSVTSTTEIGSLVTELDQVVRYTPTVRCPTTYVMEFTLADGSKADLGLACGDQPAFARGDEAFWGNRDAVLTDGAAQAIATTIASFPEPDSVVSDSLVRQVVDARVAVDPSLAQYRRTYWIRTNLAEGLLGVGNYRYDSGDWSVTIKWPVIAQPTFEISATNTPANYTWTGTLPFSAATSTQPTPVSEAQAQTRAQAFVQSSPTFAFDGVPDTLKLVETRYPNFCDNCFVFVYRFTSTHAGYGDRTGQALAQVMTTHTAMIRVQYGEVTMANLDWQWNMMAQRSWQAGDGQAFERWSEDIAAGFVRRGPTYRFDGDPNTFQFQKMEPGTCDGCYLFYFQFQSRHAGYGDRTGQQLAQVMTQHQAMIEVRLGQVDSATLDGQWDMMAQRMRNGPGGPSGQGGGQ